MNKYRLRTDLTVVVEGRTLYAIEALMDFGNVKKGDRGGYVEKEENLSQFNNSWICFDAKVYGNAYVYGNAIVSDNAKVYGKAKVYGEAKVRGFAQVHGNARVSGNAIVSSKAEVYGNARIYGGAEVYGSAKVCNCAIVWDNASVHGNAIVHGNAEVDGNAEIYGDAEVCSDEDFYVSKNIWSSGRYFTYTRSNNKWKVGCFYGTGQELIAKAYKDSEVSGREYKRIVEYVEAMYAALDKDKERADAHL